MIKGVFDYARHKESRREDQKNQAGKKENNPFSEQEKHGEHSSIRSRRTISSKRAAGHSQCPGADLETRLKTKANPGQRKTRKSA